MQQNGLSVISSNALGTTTKSVATEYDTLARQYEEQFGVSAPVPPAEKVSARGGVATLSAGVPSSPPPVSKSLGVSWVRQQTGYYCGPATGYMMLKYKGITKSRAKSTDSLTQSKLASSSYMKTDANGQTSTWSTGGHFYMVEGLNKWRSGSSTGYYTNKAINSNSGLQTLFIYSLYANESVAVSAIEYEGGAHYNSHPNRTIGHWLVGYGYSSNGATLKFKDPASGLSGGYGGSAQSFQQTSSSFYKHAEGRNSIW
ncbi:C39 family peptidase [Demequina oxidasica]|uniref:C39 family peptidase n=1 Tax=Demequina oxidasica TaxID=676199 RepID=UPI000AC32213